MLIPGNGTHKAGGGVELNFRPILFHKDNVLDILNTKTEICLGKI